MIDRMQRIAQVLQQLRALILVLALGFFGLFMAALFEWGRVDYETFSVPAVVGFGWAVVLLSFTGLFAHVPPQPEPGTPFLRRMRIRLRRGLVYFLALLMLVLTVALFMLSSQLLRSWGGT